MAQAGSTATRKCLALFTGPTGLAAAVSSIADLAGMALPPFSIRQIVAENVAPELIERSSVNRYPTVHLYCAKAINSQREKFRTFSGEAQMTAEVRVSQDRLEGLEYLTQLYVDSVTRVLDQNRGDWADGVFYGGGYEVAYGPVKQGGRNLLQIAKLTFTVEISTN